MINLFALFLQTSFSQQPIRPLSVDILNRQPTAGLAPQMLILSINLRVIAAIHTSLYAA